MARILGRIGGSSAAHPWRTLLAWLVALIAAVGLAGALGGAPHDDYSIPGMPYQQGTSFLSAHIPEFSGTSARVVIHVARDANGSGRVPSDVVEAVRERLLHVRGAATVAPARVSADGDTALIQVAYRIPVTDFTGSEGVDALKSAAAPAVQRGLQVAYGGELPENMSVPSGTAEVVGVVAALVILVIALGSLVAAGLPILVALMGLGVGTSVIGLLAAVTDISTIAPTVASMVGLGVGIDYALLLVSRHIEGLRRGLGPREAAAEATASAGSSVLLAGLTVLVSLFGLKLSTLKVYASFGYATAAVVVAVMVAAVTLVPAILGLAGRRILPRRERRAPGTAQPVTESTLTGRWAAWVGARPVRSALGALLVLGALAAPVLGMRTWPQDAGTQPESNPTRVAYDLVAAEFGPGANAPLVIAADLTRAPDVAGLVARASAEPGVVGASAPLVKNGAAVFTVQPSTGPQDERTRDLIDRLRADLPAGTYVTGIVAGFGDISDRLAERLWIVVAFVVGLSLLLLTFLFRAPVVALKAAVMNLLSVAAAYGVITAIFQTDVGARLVGLPHGTAVSSWAPILMFAVLFGLSMDYEVFLLSRIKEYWLATGDANGSVVRGLAATGRVITSAAAIMVAVFTGFALDPDVTVKTMGIGMGAAVLIDATVVRMVLVPATMALLGKANWWLPRWLDRLLPHVHVEAPPLPEREPVSVGNTV
ncbi:MMPL family transporter [Streptosporangiaceae bacterium NEAU-GS5]|nr:MMPL family transporter [Streptosporangiaceae bacterium NEAU-GS5]